MKNILIIIVAAMLLFSCNNRHTSEGQAGLPVLLSHTNNKASCVYLTNDENNKPVISWCEKDTSGKEFFFMSFFDDNKNVFDSAIALPIEQNAIFMEEGMPKIAVKKNGDILAVYETSAPTKENGWAGFVHYIQSFDKGKTWTQPLCVHQDTSSGKNHSYASVARLSDGEIGACWLDGSLGNAKQGRSIKFAKTNSRNGFQNELLIDSFACQCCRTSISSDDRGNVNIMFRDILLGSIRDIAVCTSADNGKTFTHAVTFSNDDWVINACPEDGPSVADNNGTTYAAWFTGGRKKGIYYAELNKNKEVVLKKHISNNGKFCQLCLLPGDKKAIVYNENIMEGNQHYSIIVIDKIDSGKLYTENITPQNSYASYPVVQSINANDIAVAWEQDNKIYYKILNTNTITKVAEKVSDNVMLSDNSKDLSLIKLASNNDPVCSMPLKEAEDTALYKGKVYGFCSSECKEKFEKDPASYVTTK